MSPLCVVFDIDDTLYLERDYVASGFDAVGDWTAQWLGLNGFAGICKSLFSAGVRSNIFDHALSDSGVESSQAIIQTLVEVYRTHRPQITLARDAADALPLIADRWPIAVLTDGPPAAQSSKAAALGLQAIASPIVMTSCLGNGFAKPHPKGFARIETTIRARRFVYVADNPCKDFAAPRSLGWATVRVRRPGGLHWGEEARVDAPDLELPDLTGIMPFLSSLEKSL